MVRKTTILLREDIYQALRARGGARNLSKLINEILAEYFAKSGSMFGVLKSVNTSDLRDHRDRL